MTKKSVLIVNNEASVRDMLATLFSDAGLRVSLADNGAQALQLVSHSTPHFIMDQRELLDILLAAGEDRVPVALPVTDLHLKKCLIETIDVLVGLLEITAPFFGGSSHITMQYARAVAGEMNLSTEMVDEIVVASLLHDIGRIGIRTEIL